MPCFRGLWKQVWGLEDSPRRTASSRGRSVKLAEPVLEEEEEPHVFLCLWLYGHGTLIILLVFAGSGSPAQKGANTSRVVGATAVTEGTRGLLCCGQLILGDKKWQPHDLVTYFHDFHDYLSLIIIH